MYLVWCFVVIIKLDCVLVFFLMLKILNIMGWILFEFGFKILFVNFK